MNKILSFLILLLLTTSAMAQELTPIEFNDKLVGITDELYQKGTSWGAQFNIAFKSKDFSSLRPYRESLENFIDTRIADVKAMKDVKNSKDLRMAMISFLTFEKKMATQAFKPMDQLSSSASDEEIQKAYDNLQLLATEEAAELDKVAKAQEAYGAANGFTIEPAETETEEYDDDY
jgi:hypothetical protein